MNTQQFLHMLPKLGRLLALEGYRFDFTFNAYAINSPGSQALSVHLKLSINDIEIFSEMCAFEDDKISNMTDNFITDNVIVGLKQTYNRYLEGIEHDAKIKAETTQVSDIDLPF